MKYYTNKSTGDFDCHGNEILEREETTPNPYFIDWFQHLYDLIQHDSKWGTKYHDEFMRTGKTEDIYRKKNKE